MNGNRHNNFRFDLFNDPTINGWHEHTAPVSEEVKEHLKHINETYPYCEPCVDCYYWRWSSETRCPHGFFTRDSVYSNKYYTHTSEPMCHYLLDTGNQRDSFTDEKTCPNFKPRTGKYQPKNWNRDIVAETKRNKRKDASEK